MSKSIEEHKPFTDELTAFLGEHMRDSTLKNKLVGFITGLHVKHMTKAGTEVIEAGQLRPAVQRFAEHMEDALRRNDHKGGWSNMSSSELMERLDQERLELKEATERSTISPMSLPANAKVVFEAADVANFAMMIADNHGPRIGDDRAKSSSLLSGE